MDRNYALKHCNRHPHENMYKCSFICILNDRAEYTKELSNLYKLNNKIDKSHPISIPEDLLVNNR